MKKNLYSVSYEQDPTSMYPFTVNFETTNRACYAEIRDAVLSIITQYEEKEAAKDTEDEDK